MAPTFDGKKFAFPDPLQCSECRRKHRLRFRNERCLYKRACDLTGKEIISNYSQDKPHIVYDRSIWWSDRFDPLAFGREFDFSRPFFDQFGEMIRKTPVFALSASPDAEENNCLYVNFASHNKNCYMMFDSDASEDCYYSNVMKHSLRCVDCSYVEHSELCYDSSDCTRCYDVRYSRNCDNCFESALLLGCIGCKHCISCCNLVQKEYCMFNRQVSRQEYVEAMENLRTWEQVEAAKKAFATFALNFPRKATEILNSERCTGNYICNSRDVRDSYDIGEAENIAYCDALYRAKSCQDVSSFGENIERIYNSGTIGFDVYNVACSFACRTNCSDMLHCFNCYRSHNCFGCVSLKNHRYCIFNRQYSKEEYEKLVAKIIEHMQKMPYISPDGFTGQTCEWGQYFPLQLSPFAYNETVAQEYFPLTKEEANKHGAPWRDQTEEALTVEKVIPAEQLPGTIDDIPDDILNWAIDCAVTKRPFRIVRQELDLYRQLKLPVPRFHGDERHRRRMGLRNPRNLWSRQCAKCGKMTTSSYESQRAEIVYCNDCFRREVY